MDANIVISTKLNVPFAEVTEDTTHFSVPTTFYNKQDSTFCNN